MTCTYARKDNENNLLWPQDGIGAGAFVALLENESTGLAGRLRLDQLRVVWQSVSIRRWRGGRIR